MLSHIQSSSLQKQKGVVLIISLIMLMAMTVLSVSSMTGSTIEERMAANLRDRETALQAAEGALRFGERLAQTTPVTDFTAACTNGLCENELQAHADLNHWKVDTNWTTAGKYIEYAKFTEAASRPKVIVEWMGLKVEGTDPGTGDPFGPNIFRITVIGTGQSDNSQVMLQSTYIPFN